MTVHRSTKDVRLVPVDVIVPAMAAARRSTIAIAVSEVEARVEIGTDPSALRRWTVCGRTDLEALGVGKVTRVWEFIPAKFVRGEHVQEAPRCRCGGRVISVRRAEGDREGAVRREHRRPHRRRSY